MVKESFMETSETDAQGACILGELCAGWIQNRVEVGCSNATLDYTKVVVDGACDLLV